MVFLKRTKEPLQYENSAGILIIILICYLKSGRALSEEEIMKRFIISSLLIHFGAGAFIYIYSDSEWKNKLQGSLSYFRGSISKELMDTPSYNKKQNIMVKKESSKKKDLKQNNTQKKSLKKISKKKPVFSKKIEVVKKNPALEVSQKYEKIQEDKIENQNEVKNNLEVQEFQVQKSEFPSSPLPQAEMNSELNFEDKVTQKELTLELKESEVVLVSEKEISDRFIEPELNSGSDSLNPVQEEKPLDSSSDFFVDDDVLLKEELSASREVLISKTEDHLLKDNIKNKESKFISKTQNEIQEEQEWNSEIKNEKANQEEDGSKEDVSLDRQFEDIHTDPKEIKNIIKNNVQISSLSKNSQREKKVQVNQKALDPIQGSLKIKYPEEARLEEKEGSVSLLYFVNHDGLVDRIQMLKSSGRSDLDNEALRVLARQQYPSGNSGWYKHQVDFKLKNM